MNRDELLAKAYNNIQNRALLVNLLAKRIRQLRNGAAPLVQTDFTSPLDIAIFEIAQGKIRPFLKRKSETGRKRTTKSEYNFGDDLQQ
ncbi:MAG: DNA-directed RNA polymerase subunit omega [Candidatus Tectomicrobia bacterium]|nr:DNA-directed RNA polymerase subunit omega [Candidatus Tectomicrobia bacterium]